LNITASSFVPSIKPEVEFSPSKETKPEKKEMKLPSDLAKSLFTPSTFNVFAPVFSPTIPLATASPAAAQPEPKKRGNKKKKTDSEKDKKPANNLKKYVVKGTNAPSADENAEETKVDTPTAAETTEE
jgi:hypothetical protein